MSSRKSNGSTQNLLTFALFGNDIAEEDTAPDEFIAEQQSVQIQINYTTNSVSAAPAGKLIYLLLNPAVGIKKFLFQPLFLCLVMKKIIPFFLFLFLVNNFLMAQQANLSVDLEEVEVNANSNKLYSELGRILTVIHKTEIEQLPVQTIDELLDYAAGLDIRQRGAGGVQADISIRGGSFDQVLVLLNGINITNPQTGHYNLDIPLDLSDVTRIEILQGSSARVLGANAFSGAINIITDEQAKKNQLASQITSGSYNTHTQQLSASYTKNRFSGFASASHRQSDGYIDNTDYNMSNVFLHLTQKTGNAGNFNMQVGAQHKAYGANAFYSHAYPNQFDQTKTFFSALSWSLNKKHWLWNAQMYWRQHHDCFELFRNFKDAPTWYGGHNYHQTDVTGGKATAAYLSPAGKISAGMDIRNEHIFSNVLGLEMTNTRPVPFETTAVFTHEANRLLSNLFFDYSKQFNRFYFSAGGAVHHTSDFGVHYFGGFDFGYEPNNDWKLFASFNSAVRLPTFTDLYYQSATQLSNPDLQAERSKTFEAGLKYKKAGGTLDVCAFYRLGDNIIDWVKQPDSTRWESRNLTNVNALGADVSFGYNFESSFLRNIKLAYSYLHLDKEAAGFDSKYALDYMKHKCILSVQHAVWKKLSATWRGGFFDRSGNYSDYATNELRNYAPYFLLDAKLMWSEQRFDIFTDINNLLNTDYADYSGLPQAGINWSVGLRMRVF